MPVHDSVRYRKLIKRDFKNHNLPFSRSTNDVFNKSVISVADNWYRMHLCLTSLIVFFFELYKLITSLSPV